MDTLGDLAFFGLLARHPSLAAAAIELGVTPPAVSRRLAALEQRLGVKLINRTTRRLSLTEEGERYAEEGGQLLQDLESLERSLHAGGERPQGLLKINATFGFGRRHLGPAISDFVARYPQVAIQLELSDKPLDLVDKGLDVGIVFGAPADGRLIARKIADNRRFLCASPAYLAGHPPLESPDDLRQHQCIILRERATAFNHWQLSDGRQQKLVKVRGSMAVNHGEIAVDWAIAGHGVILRSEWDIAGELRAGRLQRVLPDWFGHEADIYALYPPRRLPSARLRAFLEFLGERFAAHRSDGPGTDNRPW